MSHAATKSRTNFCLRVVARVDLGERAELGVRAEDEVDAAGGPLDLARSRGRGPRRSPPASDVGFHFVPMSSRFTKKSLVSVSGRLVKTPASTARRWPSARAGRPRARSSRARSASAGAPARSADARPGTSCPCAEVVAEPVGRRLEHGERLDVGLLLRRIRASRREGHLHVVTRRSSRPARRRRSRPARSGRPARPASSRRLRLVELRLDPLQRLQHLRQLRRVVDRPVLLRREADARAVGATALVGAAEGRRRRPGGRDQLRRWTAPRRGSSP